MKQIQLAKSLSMSSIEIAELTGKSHDNVMRDIKNMSDQLDMGLFNFEDTYIHPQNKQKYRFYNLNEELTLTLTSGYSVIQRHRIIKQWQAMRNALDAIRYRTLDTKSQIEAMGIIHKFLSPQEKQLNTPYIIANQVVNKLVGLIFGVGKAIPKKDMTLPMLERRHIILDHYVKLFEMGYPNSRIKSLLDERHLDSYRRVA